MNTKEIILAIREVWDGMGHAVSSAEFYMEDYKQYKLLKRSKRGTSLDNILDLSYK